MISGFGAAMILLGKILKNLRFIFKDFHLYAVQARDIGVASLPLVLLIGAFTGMVSTWQANYSFGSMMPEQYLGVATFKAVIIELGPVLSGLVLAGRVGSSLAAELGTMRVSEQIDAFNVLAIDPIRYLLAPRFIASLFMVPVLVTLAVFTSLWGGFMVANLFMDMGIQTYFAEIPVFFKMQDVRVMLIKATTFGATIGLIGTYVGINTTGGAEGVGQATIKAFVLSALGILFGDYFLATLLF
jgi:phospholipid/cholesterol/gamma-HCH transport system permease protein